ncbi:helix-turn-helix domain-containing protein [Agrobacterium vitis]|uniref:Helix-turn-helix domain-containing protein n=1 Tax=Agrobacterium vitis TaxID=373 RepID=A0A6L6VK56_AGRVI|nr:MULTISPECIES: helix-turn-helix transcriptional regulator [Rhizobium/Agrobacterium group]MCF1450172.1 helix-turn-helix transcriptional regulator [Allorhizobium ampelinum]MUZ76094.1 helix-turn-helix domain-containing protein [Agrobacterium vitis]
MELVTDTSATRLTDDMANYAEKEGLIAVTDQEVETTIYRRPGFEGVLPLADFEDRIGAWLKSVRASTNLSQEEFGQFLGLTKIAYGRYERGKAKLTLSRYIVICEILGLNPIDGFYNVAPHLFGTTSEIAEQRRNVQSKIATMNDDMLSVLHQMLTNIEALKAAAK